MSSEVVWGRQDISSAKLILANYPGALSVTYLKACSDEGIYPGMMFEKTYSLYARAVGENLAWRMIPKNLPLISSFLVSSDNVRFWAQDGLFEECSEDEADIELVEVNRDYFEHTNEVNERNLAYFFLSSRVVNGVYDEILSELEARFEQETPV